MEIINQLDIKGTGFADDCSLLLHRENPQHAVDILNRVLKELTDWGRTVGLTFNPQKNSGNILHKIKQAPTPWEDQS